MDSPSAPSENLPQFLRARARAASDGRLVLDVALGVLAAVAVLVWRPWFWRPLLSAAIILAAFGGWGMVDRELGERVGSMNSGWRFLLGARALLSATGWFAFAVFVVSALALAIGEWKL